jgi:hypothetical protein
VAQYPKPEDSKAEFPMPAEGVYLMELHNVGEEHIGKFPDKHGDFHTEENFYFHIKNSAAFPVTQEFVDFELMVYVRSDTFYDGSAGGNPATSYVISKALLGSEFNASTPPNSWDLIGRQCYGTIRHKDSFDEGGKKTGTWAKLTGYAPVSQAPVVQLTAAEKRAALEKQLAELTGEPTEETDVDDIPF